MSPTRRVVLYGLTVGALIVVLLTAGPALNAAVGVVEGSTLRALDGGQSGAQPAPPAGAAVKIEAIGPQVGAKVPEFSGVDQFGQRHDLQSVRGREGAMLVFFRSADW